MKEKFLVFDIETVPLNWETFSESQQEYLMRRAETDEEKEKKLMEMALTPLTAMVVTIGMQLLETNDDGGFNLIKRAAFSVDETMTDNDEREVVLTTGDSCFLYSERTMLEKFWKIFQKYDHLHLISFNGRNFDAPFLMLRSSLLKVRPARNLMSGTKFNYSYHTDLIDELSFFSSSYYGATKRFNFDFYARAYGITSPKAAGIDGSKVPEFYHNGKIDEISEYCLRDVNATWELYLEWRKYLKF
jgi:3'-5' exonuclease